MALAQQTAVAMAKAGDWGASLVGEPSLTANSEAGKDWLEAATDAHSAAMDAAAAAGVRASNLAADVETKVPPSHTCFTP